MDELKPCLEMQIVSRVRRDVINLIVSILNYGDCGIKVDDEFSLNVRPDLEWELSQWGAISRRSRIDSEWWRHSATAWQTHGRRFHLRNVQFSRLRFAGMTQWTNSFASRFVCGRRFRQIVVTTSIVALSIVLSRRVIKSLSASSVDNLEHSDDKDLKILDFPLVFH